MRVSIQEIANLLNVSTQSIRLWEKKGLIPKSERTLGGHRRYDLKEVKKALEKK
jgi:excisionase family DNA binding protein